MAISGQSSINGNFALVKFSLSPGTSSTWNQYHLLPLLVQGVLLIESYAFCILEMASNEQKSSWGITAFNISNQSLLKMLPPVYLLCNHRTCPYHNPRGCNRVLFFLLLTCAYHTPFYYNGSCISIQP